MNDSLHSSRAEFSNTVVVCAQALINSATLLTILIYGGFPCGSGVKNPPAMQETRVCSLGWEDPLEEEMAAHSIFLPGEFNGQRSLVGYSPWGCKESDKTE